MSDEHDEEHTQNADQAAPDSSDPTGNDDAPANNNAPKGYGNMGRRVTFEMWQRLLEGWRQHGNAKKAAEFAGIDRRTAKRAYDEGLPHHPWGRVPIKELIVQEHSAVRATIHAQTAAAAHTAAAATAMGHSPTAAAALAFSAMGTIGVPNAPTTPEEARLLAAQARADALRAKTEKVKTVRMVRGTLTLIITQTARIARANDLLMERLTTAIGKLLPSVQTMEIPGYEPNLDNMRFIIELTRQTRDLQTTNVKMLADINKMEEEIIGKDDPLLAGFDGDENDAIAEVKRMAEQVEQIERHRKKKAAGG